MLLATLLCSDEACADEVEAWTSDLEEVDALVCPGCGCALLVIAVAEAEPAPLVHLPRASRLQRAA